MTFNWFEQAVDYAEGRHAEKDGRQFEASVRESLAALGFDTTLVADGELDGEIVNNYEVEAADGTYALEINRDAGELEVYDRT